jgi:hypothetical protein
MDERCINAALAIVDIGAPSAAPTHRFREFRGIGSALAVPSLRL